ncbi:hypothetical protein [Pseudoalteromonas marina]|uniref:Uncharacterized protein n=1 Tax=Pseudoalteromonas marina TaxID=267375 RepID=A0ABT9FCH1_9GAMM|nr:hypothetical protein [Pseudoalteromonas marina]MDP2564465.1 hypothetical protein [Pseudoalteromonas marina]
MNIDTIINSPLDNLDTVLKELIKIKDRKKLQFKLDIHNTPTAVQLCPRPSILSISAWGRFVSHSGYQSIYSVDFTKGKTIKEAIVIHLEKQYEAGRKLPYIVWKEHKENGWKDILHYDNEYIVRIPDWADSCIEEALEYVGFHERSKANRHWAINPKTLSKSDIKLILKPAMKDNTRLKDESTLANEIKKSFDDFCIEFRKPSLFEDMFADENENMEKPKKRIEPHIAAKMHTSNEVQLSFF